MRGLSSYIVDDLPHLRRWVAGDSVAAAGGLGGTVFLGGLSVSRNFDLDPYFVRYPTLSLAGAVTTPSTVDVYVNGALVRREPLPPGTFDLTNLSVPTGSGTTRVVIRDAFGQEHALTNPFYASTAVLGKGLQDYGYNLGFRPRPDLDGERGLRLPRLHGPPPARAHRHAHARRAARRREGDRQRRPRCGASPSRGRAERRLWRQPKRERNGIRGLSRLPVHRAARELRGLRPGLRLPVREREPRRQPGPVPAGRQRVRRRPARPAGQSDASIHRFRAPGRRELPAGVRGREHLPDSRRESLRLGRAHPARRTERERGLRRPELFSRGEHDGQRLVPAPRRRRDGRPRGAEVPAVRNRVSDTA